MAECCFPTMATNYFGSKLDELKEFVFSKLKVDGSWSSLGGDVKLFIGEKISLKWQGKHRQKLLVFSDNDHQDLGDELIKLVVSSKNTNSTSSSKCEQEANMAVLPINDTD